MSKRATHIGHCQACGRRQMLPGGLLAKHGYAVMWNSFQGTCPGSERKPFETHTDYIAQCIAGAEQHASHLKQQAEMWRVTGLDESGDARAWVHEYRPARYGRGGRGGYQWSQRKLIEIHRYDRGDGTERIVASYIAADGKPAIGVREGGASLDEIARGFNAKYADHLDKLAAKQTEYANWQRNRIANWKPAELTARKENDGK